MVSTFRFKKLDTIGNPSAESDAAFLHPCFVDNGELDYLRDSFNEQGIVVGRTGAGKTALLKTLVEREERVIELDPHNLACGYISNSTVIKFFEALNIKMDLFYKLLWKHVFVVEILKKKFDLHSEEDRLNFFDNTVYTLLRKKAHKEAFSYLNTWGTTFWETTEDRIKEITRKVETDLKATTDVQIQDFIKLGIEGTQQLTEEQRREITQRGQEVINKVQMSKLASLFDALDEEILTDPKKRYFIIIDRLDEDWADNAIRYRLIRALIETMREVNSKIRFAKIIIALRADLLDRVLKATTDSGFQDEKYRGLCLPISWSRPMLIKLLDTRINELVRRSYTGQLVIPNPPTH
jgi:ABC-type cobalamin/Fe3+-siderophores transport system ATPase subunit